MSRIIVVIFCFLTTAVTDVVFSVDTTQAQRRIVEAQQWYQTGEEADIVAERRAAFNRALDLFTTLEAEEGGDSGALNFNIANSYFQLQEYPRALLFYERARRTLPRESKVRQNLAIAREQLGIVEKRRSPFTIERFSGARWFSLSERLTLLALLASAATIVGSLAVWRYRPWIYRSAMVSAVAAAVVLLSVTIERYVSPVRAVVIEATLLYRDSGRQYARVQQEPVLSGTTVQVIEVEKQGRWLRVITPQGTMGYIPHESSRLI